MTLAVERRSDWIGRTINDLLDLLRLLIVERIQTSGSDALTDTRKVLKDVNDALEEVEGEQ